MDRRRHQITAQRRELRQTVERRIDAEYEARAGLRHAPQVIAVAAADIEYATAGQWPHMGQYPRPFPVAAPFTVDQDIEQCERPLAPRRKRHEGSAQSLTRGGLARPARAHSRPQTALLDRQRWQRREGRLPLRHTAIVRESGARAWQSLGQPRTGGWWQLRKNSRQALASLSNQRVQWAIGQVQGHGPIMR